MPKEAKYAVVIKTDSYAGNFEREMCAELTGHVGECGVGEELVDDEIANMFEDIIVDEPDDNGCYRPVALGCDIDGFTNQDVIIYFDCIPTDSHIDTMKERSVDFRNSKGIKISGFELVEFKSTISTIKL